MFFKLSERAIKKLCDYFEGESLRQAEYRSLVALRDWVECPICHHVAFSKLWKDCEDCGYIA